MSKMWISETNKWQKDHPISLSFTYTYVNTISMKNMSDNTYIDGGRKIHIRQGIHWLT